MAIKKEKLKKTKVEKMPQMKISGERLLRVKLVRSLIGHPRKQREVVKGLGLRRINSEVIRKDCSEIWGMINKVQHLVRVKVMDKK